jgi:hypothetical protein
MEGQSTNALFARVLSHERNRYKSSSGRYKSKGISKSPEKVVKVCWRCGKEGHCKKQCRSKSVERVKGVDDAPSIEKKTFVDGGDVYMILQEHMQIMRHGQSTQVHHFT